MSALSKFLRGWQFRTSTPGLETGAELSVQVTGYDDGEGAAVARIGDTRLLIDGTSRDHVDKIAHVVVTEFDDGEHVGRARLREVVGETTY
jgi:hypothetical protein